jgi:hypothetical protein
VGTVTVTRTATLISGVDRNAYSWAVEFDSAAGDLPLLYATPGRLMPLASHCSVAVTEVVSGTAVVLVYDGTGVPDVRTASVSSLVSDQTYSFKVNTYTSHH